MSARRSKDPLTAATTTVLIPALAPHGFQRRSRRLLGRLGECAFQLLDLQKGSSGASDFCVNYASMLLVPPQDHLVLQPGERLRSAKGGDAWWMADSHDRADSAMRQAVEAFTGQALHFFEATRSASGLYRHLLEDEWGSRHHLELARGACAAWLDDVARAREHLGRAIVLYDQDGRSWCPQYRARAQTLIHALEGGSHGGLLREWRAESVRLLGLEDLQTEPTP